MTMGVSAKCTICDIEFEIGGVVNLKECEGMTFDCANCKTQVIIKNSKVIEYDKTLDNHGIRKSSELRINDLKPIKED